ncbi:MAG: M48 family metallopeptidase [Weeksellaceae bacterium]|nr:M48 family metallopeptidase [Weeksellaceae bacterium]
MKKMFVLAFAAIIMACSTNPITGKRPLILISNSQLFPMSFSQYSEVIANEKLSTNQAQTNQLRTVGNRIRGAVERYLAEQNQSDFLNGYEWEFNLIEKDALNAFCMPGGKVAFYTGILPVCKNDDGIAVVMGHEITHAVAEHSAQRVSQAMIAQGLQLAGNVAIGDARYRNVFNQIYPLGASMGIMAYGRQAELEADKVGLHLMAMAGYDPREAPKFWERMDAEAQRRGQQAPPEFLSTHPNPGRRIAQLQAEVPKVMPIYYQATGQSPR